MAQPVPKLQDTLNDPKFQSLTPGAQKIVLGQRYPAFTKLSSTAQEIVLSHAVTPTNTPTGAPQAPAAKPITGSVAQQSGGLASDDYLGKAIGVLGAGWKALNTPVGDFPLLGGHEGNTQDYITKAATLGQYGTADAEKAIAQTPGKFGPNESAARVMVMGSVFGKDVSAANTAASMFATPLGIATFGIGGLLEKVGLRVAEFTQGLSKSLDAMETLKNSNASADALESAQRTVAMSRSALVQAEQIHRGTKALMTATGLGFGGAGVQDAIEATKDFDNPDATVRSQAYSKFLQGTAQLGFGVHSVADAHATNDTPKHVARAEQAMTDVQAHIDKLRGTEPQTEVPTPPPAKVRVEPTAPPVEVPATITERGISADASQPSSHTVGGMDRGQLLDILSPEKFEQQYPTLPTTPVETPAALQPQAIAAENDWFKQAKSELGEGATSRQVLQRAQELKEGTKSEAELEIPSAQKAPSQDTAPKPRTLTDAVKEGKEKFGAGNFKINDDLSVEPKLAKSVKDLAEPARQAAPDISALRTRLLAEGHSETVVDRVIKEKFPDNPSKLYRDAQDKYQKASNVYRRLVRKGTEADPAKLDDAKRELAMRRKVMLDKLEDHVRSQSPEEARKTIDNLNKIAEEHVQGAELVREAILRHNRGTQLMRSKLPDDIKDTAFGLTGRTRIENQVVRIPADKVKNYDSKRIKAAQQALREQAQAIHDPAERMRLDKLANEPVILRPLRMTDRSDTFVNMLKDRRLPLLDVNHTNQLLSAVDPDAPTLTSRHGKLTEVDKQRIEALQGNIKDAIQNGNKALEADARQQLEKHYDSLQSRFLQGIVSRKLTAAQSAFEEANRAVKAAGLSPSEDLKNRVTHFGARTPEVQAQIDGEVREALRAARGPAPTEEDKKAPAQDVMNFLKDEDGSFDNLGPLRALAKGQMWARAKVEGIVPDEVDSRGIARGTLRQRLGELARSKEQLYEALNPEVSKWDKATAQQSIDFIDRMETGQHQGNIMDDVTARILRTELDKRREAIRALGTGKLDSYLENYFPHIWDNVGRAQDVIKRILYQRKPLQGSAGFLKHREYDTFKEGLNAGLDPVTYNPVTLSLLRMHEMDRYIMGNKVFMEYENMGLLKSRPKDVEDTWARKSIDPSWQRISRNVFNVEAYAHPEVAKVLNNYLSPGLWNKTITVAGHDIPLYNLIRGYNNFRNQAQLGISGFHALGTSINTVVSDFAMGLQKASRGDLKGALTYTGRAGTLFLSPVTAYMRGNALLKEYLEPGKFAAMSHVAEALEMGGGRVRMDSFYKSDQIQAMKRNWKTMQDGNALLGKRLYAGASATVRAPFALLEKFNKPLMEHFIPRMKLGIFADMANDVFDRLGPEATPELIREHLGRAWDSVDNRMGQLVYDNLFWNRTGKDLAMASVRSVGWNLGTFRELGGGITDFARQDLRSMVGKRPEMTTRMAYALALPVMVGYMGAIYNYLHTGQAPQSMEDLYFPRTGKQKEDGSPERVSLPTYMRDVFAFSRHPIDTVIHKVASAINDIAEAIQNKDFYGTEIIHPDDPALKIGEEAIAHWFAGYKPFSVGNLQQRKKLGADTIEQASSFIGITPAPAWVGQSPATQKSNQYMQKYWEQGPRTTAEFEKFQAKAQMRSDLNQGKLSYRGVYQAAQQGKITWKEADSIVDSKGLTPLERNFKELRQPEEALSVWRVATPAEKVKLKPLMLNKLIALFEDNTPHGTEMREIFKNEGITLGNIPTQ